MRETIVSKSEKSFILAALAEKKRLDGRTFDEFRDLKINFGSDWGSCLVTLGATKVLAQVSCEVQQPKPTRPNEGLLMLFVELSPMAAPHFEAGRQSDLGVQLNRLLEKCIKDSRCVDLESLCITAEEKVWALRIDVNVLNHEGNLVDAASVAALTALAHFRRPDITTTGEQTIIHDPAERDPIPVSLHHHPVCVTYGIFDNGNFILADPSALEERVADGQMVFGVNAFRELCGLHLEGRGQVTTDVVLQCTVRVAQRALEVVNLIKKALEEDLKARNCGSSVGFREYFEESNLLSLQQDRFSIQLHGLGWREGGKQLCKAVKKKIAKQEIESESENDSTEEESSVEEPFPAGATAATAATAAAAGIVVSLGEGSAELLDSKELTLKEESSDEDSDLEVVAQFDNRTKPSKFIESIELSGDSEEEETVTLEGAELNEEDTSNRKAMETENEPARATSRAWYTKSTW